MVSASDALRGDVSRLPGVVWPARTCAYRSKAKALFAAAALATTSAPMLLAGSRGTLAWSIETFGAAPSVAGPPSEAGPLSVPGPPSVAGPPLLFEDTGALLQAASARTRAARGGNEGRRMPRPRALPVPRRHDAAFPLLRASRPG